MNKRILIVDDEKNILDGYKRTLRSDFEIETSVSGAEAIEIIKSGSPFAVVISDYKMPEMNGAEFLEKARELSPDSTRIMLSGQADFQAVIDVINRGNIFRFLMKPCSQDDMKKNIDDGVRQYELVTAEREILSKTLGGSIKVLTDLLALAKPQAFSRAQRIRALVHKIIYGLDIGSNWQIEIASMLSQIGCVTIPDDILKKAYKGTMLGNDEIVMYRNHPVIAKEMIERIPRLEEIGKIISYQEKNYDGTGFPYDKVAGTDIPLGARALRIAIDLDKFISSGMNEEHAYEELLKTRLFYDPELIKNLKKTLGSAKTEKTKFIMKDSEISALKEGMYMAQDVITAAGSHLASKNQKITSALIITFQNYEKDGQIKSPLKVLEHVETV